MGRPHKLRKIEFPPIYSFYKPANIPLFQLDEIELSVDEYEAIRLSDYDGLNHAQSAKKMNVSRPTFTRIIESAHQKIAQAFVEGKAIHIQGGHYQIGKNLFRCNDCNYTWNEEEGNDVYCPKCHSSNITCLGHLYGRKCRHKHRRCHGNS